MPENTVIEVKNLTHVYQPMGEVALKNVNLTVKEGEFIAIIGQNGSGKTTLIKHLNGLLKATKGEVIVGGKLITDQKVSDLAHFIGYVFQNPEHQIFAETVEEEVAFGPKNLGFPSEKIKEMVDKSLDSLGLSHHRESMPFMLGRGEMQRLAVASILAMDPKVLIIDEPTTGLDWRECVRVLDLVKQLNEKGHTIIMTTHNMSIVSLYAKRVAVLRLGKKILDGPTNEVFRKTEILKTAFIKAPQIFRLMAQFPQIKLKNYDIDHVAGQIYNYIKGDLPEWRR